MRRKREWGEKRDWEGGKRERKRKDILPFLTHFLKLRSGTGADNNVS